jgi:hypothetical protein
MGERSTGDEIKIGNQILNEDDLKFEVTHNGEVFTLRLPTPWEKAAIEAEIARKLGGYSRTAFPTDHLALIEATAYVNQLVVPEASPSWFKSAWTCYDEDCIAALYQGYLRFRNKFQTRLRGDRPEKGGTGSKS